MIVSEVVASYNIEHQRTLISARLESMAFRYNGATSVEDLSEYVEDHEAIELAAFIAESQAELESLREAANEMRPPSLMPEEENIFTDDVIRGLAREEQFSLSYVVKYEEDPQSLYWRLYRIFNKTR